ncbi:SDR family NAD(P)-dependent oxidoreductase [Microlunatus speluncae]|uniref:SDR family NAD(P)-dependent oxidoreductase n=1 Tax=Microlunatus speluncae TaxID=2594267 RepID=UPI0012660CAE|nr:SDR family oxidoreductase [Microlunatus speluncae]
MPSEISGGGKVVITGATGGLGVSFARALAAQGRELVLVGRNAAALDELAGELGHFRVGVESVIADLADPVAVSGLVDRLAEVDVDLLINNAGFAQHGPYEQLDRAEQHDQLQVCVVALADLAQGIAPQLVRRGRGGMINVASTAAFQPTPYLTAYAASKAFVLSFSQALHAELRSKGVTVTALCPGPVMTKFWEQVGSTDAAFGQRLPADRVVAQGLAGYRRGQPVVVPGWRNRATVHANRLIPRRLAATIAGLAVRPRGR